MFKRKSPLDSQELWRYEICRKFRRESWLLLVLASQRRGMKQCLSQHQTNVLYLDWLMDSLWQIVNDFFDNLVVVFFLGPMNRMKMIVAPSERKNLRIANSWISRIATFWDLWRELTWLHIVRLHFWKREFVTDRFFFSSTVEPRYDEPRYNEVLFFTNDFLYSRNSNIYLGPRYNETSLYRTNFASPLALRYIDVPLYCYFYKDWVSRNKRHFTLFLDKILLQKMLIPESRNISKKVSFEK